MSGLVFQIITISYPSKKGKLNPTTFKHDIGKIDTVLNLQIVFFGGSYAQRWLRTALRFTCKNNAPTHPPNPNHPSDIPSIPTPSSRPTNRYDLLSRYVELMASWKTRGMMRRFCTKFCFVLFKCLEISKWIPKIASKRKMETLKVRRLLSLSLGCFLQIGCSHVCMLFTDWYKNVSTFCIFRSSVRYIYLWITRSSCARIRFKKNVLPKVAADTICLVKL